MAEAKVIIKAEDRTQAAFRSVQNNLRSLAKYLPATLSAAGFIGFSKAALAAAINSEQAGTRLDAVLKATGLAAGLTRKELDEMAESMAASTQFDDEAIRNAASELLKFRNIQGDTFRETLKLSADVAAFFSEDIPSAAAKLGKSLEDVDSAFGLLKRAGVVLTEQQQDLIRSMELSGDKAGAQQVVLEKLKGTFGGTAETMNTGLNKATRDLAKSWNELLESIGKTPEVQTSAKGALGWLSSNLDGLTARIRELGLIKGTLADLSQGFVSMYDAAAGGRRSDRFGLGQTLKGARDWLNAKPLNLGPTSEITEEDPEKAKALLAARKQKEDAAADAAYQRSQKTQGILADLRKATLENQAAITDDEKQKARLRVDAAREEMEKKLKLLEKQGVSRKAVESDYNKWLVSEQAKAAYESRTPMEKLNAEWQNTTQQMQKATAGWANETTDALVKMVRTGKLEFGSLVNSVLDGLLRMAIQKNITGPLFSSMESGGFFSAIASMFGGAYAHGGNPPVGRPSLVGERGPELFVPRTAGTIVPNDRLGGGDVIVNVINQTSTPVQAKSNGGRPDGRNYIVDVVLSDIDNYGPLRNAIVGVR